MPDQNYRPTHGLPPDSRPANVPPEWWALLNRNDLPKGGGDPDDIRAHRGSRDDDIIHALRGQRSARPRAGWPRSATTAALLVIAALLLIIGVGPASSNGGAVVLIVVGLLILMAALALQVARVTLRRR